MVILHDATKTIQNGVLAFFLKKIFFKNPKKPGRVVFLRKNSFFSTLI